MILHNSCSLMISMLTWPLIRKNLVVGEKSAFWTLVFVIGFIEGMAFLASSFIGHGRWQVNVFQSVLYLVGIGLCAYPVLKTKSGLYVQTAGQVGSAHVNAIADCLRAGSE